MSKQVGILSNFVAFSQYPNFHNKILSYRDMKNKLDGYTFLIFLVTLSKCVEGVEEGIEIFVSSAASWL